MESTFMKKEILYLKEQISLIFKQVLASKEPQ